MHPRRQAGTARTHTYVQAHHRNHTRLYNTATHDLPAGRELLDLLEPTPVAPTDFHLFVRLFVFFILLRISFSTPENQDDKIENGNHKHIICRKSLRDCEPT